MKGLQDGANIDTF